MSDSQQKLREEEGKIEQQQQLVDVADVNDVPCAAHGARFDVTTGNKVAEPMALDPSKFPEPLPESLQKMFARSAEIMSKVKTYNQQTYETKIEGNRVKVRM